MGRFNRWVQTLSVSWAHTSNQRQA